MNKQTFIIIISFLLLLPGAQNAHTIVPAHYHSSGIFSYEIDDTLFLITAHSRSFAPGDAGYLEVIGTANADMQYCEIAGEHFPLSRTRWGWKAFFAIPSDLKKGEQDILLHYRYRGKSSVSHLPVMIFSKKFKTSRHALNLGRFSRVPKKNTTPNPEVLKFLQYCRERKDRAFASVSKDYTDSQISHPRDMHYITSSFHETRFYKRYRIYKRRRIYLTPNKRVHFGVDLRGAAGSPVYAMLRGKVVLAEKMFYEGNMVIIDHGNSFFTYYMHMKELCVKEGSIVNAGEVIGTVGSTGMSTGPHLHVSAIIAGSQVDPLSLLYLPVRK